MGLQRTTIKLTIYSPSMAVTVTPNQNDQTRALQIKNDIWAALGSQFPGSIIEAELIGTNRLVVAVAAE